MKAKRQMTLFLTSGRIEFGIFSCKPSPSFRGHVPALASQPESALCCTAYGDARFRGVLSSWSFGSRSGCAGSDGRMRLELETAISMRPEVRSHGDLVASDHL